MPSRSLLSRLHVWLGWIIGVPLLIWAGTGLFMVAQPIERVRGEHLKRPAPALVLRQPIVAPQTGARAVKSITLEQRFDGPVWVIAYQDGAMAIADPASGKLLPPIDRARASQFARASFAGEAALVSVTPTSAKAPPVDLRRARPAWCATFADDTRVYVDADTGSILATQTALWRVFDFMWGLHIMDLRTREETSHPILIASSAIALIAVILGVILLPRRRARRP